jgi:hypothetical protein
MFMDIVWYENTVNQNGHGDWYENIVHQTSSLKLCSLMSQTETYEGIPSYSVYKDICTFTDVTDIG